jgi:hypothetical protein
MCVGGSVFFVWSWQKVRFSCEYHERWWHYVLKKTLKLKWHSLSSTRITMSSPSTRCETWKGRVSCLALIYTRSSHIPNEVHYHHHHHQWFYRPCKDLGRLTLFRNLINTHGRTPSDEWSARRKGLYLHRTTQHINTTDKHPCPQRNSNQRSQQPSGRRPTPYRPRGHRDRQRSTSTHYTVHKMWNVLIFRHQSSVHLASDFFSRQFLLHSAESCHSAGRK